MFDPLFAVACRTLTKQEGAAHATGDAVVPTGYGGVDEVRTSHRHRWDLQGCRRSLPKLTGFVKRALHVLCHHLGRRLVGRHPPHPWAEEKLALMN